MTDVLIRTEQHIIPFDKIWDNYSFKSKNLYNYCLYQIRQHYFEHKELLNCYALIKLLTAENQVDYRALSAQTSQDIIKLLYKNFTSFFKATKAYAKNPKRFKAKPRIPQYKDKVSGRNLLIFSNQQAHLKNGFIHFPKFYRVKPLKTRVTNLNQVRIIPKQSHFVIEVIYEKEAQIHDLNVDSFVSIDLGVNNLATLIGNSGASPILLNGRMVKAENQYYNKFMTKLKSESPERTTHRMERLSLKRSNWISNYFHQVSHYIIQYCITNKIGTIVVGYNKEWKQECNLGKKNNQKFVFIPFNKLRSMIEYKCKEHGIQYIETEESYTSKVDHLAGEVLGKHDTYMGRRIKRGLFKSSTGKLINADVNGALGISRKVFGDWHLMPEANRGFADNPVKWNILINNYKDKNLLTGNSPILSNR